MPPSPQEPLDTGHQLPPHRSSAGAFVGAVIIVVLLLIGALYFWGMQLNHRSAAEVPYIPAGTTTITVTQ